MGWSVVSACSPIVTVIVRNSVSRNACLAVPFLPFCSALMNAFVCCLLIADDAGEDIL